MGCASKVTNIAGKEINPVRAWKMRSILTDRHLTMRIAALLYKLLIAANSLGGGGCVCVRALILRQEITPGARKSSTGKGSPGKRTTHALPRRYSNQRRISFETTIRLYLYGIITTSYPGGLYDAYPAPFIRVL